VQELPAHLSANFDTELAFISHYTLSPIFLFMNLLLSTSQHKVDLRYCVRARAHACTHARIMSNFYTNYPILRKLCQSPTFAAFNFLSVTPPAQ